ncbi:MAG TPA: cytochrome C oxidase subunit IV family protein [Chthoniobacterales bacterium]|nr:cytochrome C oxidase subunit IV family protein [Chthoniobacterales bacterium]
MNETHEPIADAAALPADAHAAQAAHDEHVAHDVSKHIRAYLMVGLTLIAFTAITVGLSYVDFGTQKANVAVALVVATFKAALVAAIFMHLSNEKRMIYRILIFTAFFVLGLFFLTYLAWYDPIVR